MSLSQFLMESHTQKEQQPWSSLCTWLERKTSQRQSVSISTSTSSRTHNWMICWTVSKSTSHQLSSGNKCGWRRLEAICCLVNGKKDQVNLKLSRLLLESNTRPWESIKLISPTLRKMAQSQNNKSQFRISLSKHSRFHKTQSHKRFCSTTKTWHSVKSQSMKLHSNILSRICTLWRTHFSEPWFGEHCMKWSETPELPVNSTCTLF